jgi:GH15 family glucan-1,4-alpha-glucosidase
MSVGSDGDMGTTLYTGSGYGQAEVLLDGEPQLRLTSDLNLGFEGPRALARRRLAAGEQVFCARSWNNAEPPQTFGDAHDRLAGTAEFWHQWLSRGDFPDHPWRKHLQRSALTLKGLIYAPTGALLAAASSLPETPGGERNYDYRYSWLRDSVYLHTRSRDGLDERRWPMVKRQVEEALKHWRDPDQGLWEVRGPAQHFTASKVLCWVAADRGAKLAALRGDHDLAASWRQAADEIHADVCARGVDKRGVFCQHYDTTALDASPLLIPLLGFLPPGDERVRATVLAIADELTEDELVLRYRVEDTDDGR